jgi:hypothetical protein
MQPELAAPEIFIAEGIEAKDLLALLDQVRILSGLCLHARRAKQGQDQHQNS